MFGGGSTFGGGSAFGGGGGAFGQKPASTFGAFGGGAAKPTFGATTGSTFGYAFRSAMRVFCVLRVGCVPMERGSVQSARERARGGASTRNKTAATM